MVGPITDPYILARFFSRVDYGTASECWEWTHLQNSTGYGRFSLSDKTHLAHRVSYQIFVASIPEGKVVCHQCDNRLCVNPAHLWLGTQSDNISDAVKKGRIHRPDTRGAQNGNTPLTEPDVVAIKRALGAGSRQKDLAQSFCVDVSTISNIKLGKTWSHINA